MKKRLVRFAVIAASGAVTALTLQIDLLYPLSYVSVAPFFFLLLTFTDEKMSYGKLYAYGLLWSMSYCLTVYSFFLAMYPLEFMEIGKVAAFFTVIFCQFGLSLLQSVPNAAIAPLFRLTCRHRPLSPLLFACLYIIFEWLQNFTWAGVPFLRLAISQTSFIPAMQSASVLGSLFLSFIPAFTGACIGLALFYCRKYGRDSFAVRLYPIIAIALIGANIGFGLIRMGTYTEKDQTEVRVALIQANIGSDDKWSDTTENRFAEIVNRHLALAGQAIDESGASMVVFAETAINFDFLSWDDTDIKDRFCDFAVSRGVTLFVGTFTQDADENSFNSIVAFYSDGSIEETPYSKRRLVPFGEFMPMESLLTKVLPFLSDMNLFSDPITPGKGSCITEANGGKIGRLICFDSIYDGLTRQSVADGAQMLILSTNDSWYLDSPAVYIHNDHARLRAVESGRYILRAANTGVSSIIDPLGRTESELGPLKEGYVTGTAVFRSERTLFSYTGNIIISLAFIFVFYEAASEFIRIRRGKKSEKQD